jgi:signal transduction histidine kinase/CheY-like chemotaxis protein
MRRTLLLALRRFAIVPPVIGAALLLRYLLWPVLGAELPLLFMWPAVLVSAWWGGFGPGLLATLLSALAECYFVLEPRHSFEVHSPAVQVGLVLFVPLGVAVSLLVERLRSANRMIREAGRRKDEFLAFLGHELRGHLSPVLHASQVLRVKPALENDLQWAGGVIERQVNLLTYLIDDLLDASRIGQGKLRLQKQVVELAPVVTHAIEVTRPLLKGRKQKLTVSLPPEPLYLTADPTRLTQILVNLLTNAAKYTDEEGQIQINAHTEGPELILRIHDTGIGIARELLGRIFEPFTQGPHGVSRSQGGLGIGLALVRNLVAVHGGSITARSEGVGHGSEFVVRLPRMTRRQPPEGFNKADKELGLDSINACRVLVVDDQVDAAEGLAMLLRIQGHEVQTAADGPHALRIAASFHPEVVLLDINLPQMDGYEVARRLRHEVGLTDAILVAMTGAGLDADGARDQEALFAYWLMKPLDCTVLNQVLAARTATMPGKSGNSSSG